MAIWEHLRHRLPRIYKKIQWKSCYRCKRACINEWVLGYHFNRRVLYCYVDRCFYCSHYRRAILSSNSLMRAVVRNPEGNLKSDRGSEPIGTDSQNKSEPSRDKLDHEEAQPEVHLPVFKFSAGLVATHLAEYMLVVPCHIIRTTESWNGVFRNDSTQHQTKIWEHSGAR